MWTLDRPQKEPMRVWYPREIGTFTLDTRLFLSVVLAAAPAATMDEVRVRVNPYICILTHTYINIYICIYVCIYIDIFVCIYIYICIYIYTCIYVYIYTRG